MSWKEDTLQAIKGLWGWIQVADASDKEVIIGIGTSLESGFRNVPEDEKLASLVTLMLTQLQAIYQDQVGDPKATLTQIARCVESAQSFLEDKAQADVVDQAISALNEVAGAAPGAGEPDQTEDQTPQPEGQAQAETPAESDTQPAGEADGSIAGVYRLICDADATDETQIGAIYDALMALAASENLSTEACEAIGSAGYHVGLIAQGMADDPAGSLQEARTELEPLAQEGVEPEPVGEDQPQPPAEQELEPAGEEQPEPVAEEETPEPAAQETTEAEAAEEPVAQPEEPQETTQADAGQGGTQVEAPEFSGPAVVPDAADVDLMKDFIIECLDHINMAEAALLELESNPEDAEQVNVVFRAFHTIKGTSGFLDLDRIQKLAHLAENLLDRARDGEIRISGGFADLALQSSDALKVMIEGLDGAAPGSPLVVPDNLTDLLRILTDPEAAGVNDEESVEPMRVGDILVGKGQAQRDQVEETDSSKGDKKIGQALVEKGAAKPQDVRDAVRTQKKMSGGAGATTESSVRVTTGRLDQLINMVGELVIAQSMVAQDPVVATEEAGRLARNVSHAGKIIRELQDLTMGLRMVPLKQTFQKMARLVRDVSKKAGKQVRFVTEGEETEIDRTMVESLGDPLIHMMRNSCDHGIEPADVRADAGKDPTGTVTLRAYHAAGNVVIEIKDDGKGLDREKILAKGIERGLVDKNRAKEMSDNDVFMLIFQPGFSTADQITDVSGRGVGMDVVRKNIEKVRGRVEVTSVKGEGSTFTVRLPLTMAITDAMLVRVGDQRYLLPTISIEQSFRPAEGMVSTVTGRGEAVLLRGELLPIFRLNQLFDIDGGEQDPYDALLIIIEGEGKRCALMVDELLGQQQVVIKSLGSMLGHIPGVSGGAILGDGRVGLILDATGILKLSQEADGSMMDISAA